MITFKDQRALDVLAQIDMAKEAKRMGMSEVAFRACCEAALTMKFVSALALQSKHLEFDLVSTLVTFVVTAAHNPHEILLTGPAIFPILLLAGARFEGDTPVAFEPFMAKLKASLLTFINHANPAVSKQFTAEFDTAGALIGFTGKDVPIAIGESNLIKKTRSLMESYTYQFDPGLGNRITATNGATVDDTIRYIDKTTTDPT